MQLQIKTRLLMAFFLLLFSSFWLKAQFNHDFTLATNGDLAESQANTHVEDGHVYTVQTTASANLPTTTGTSLNGGSDIYITKATTAGVIVYQTYLGSELADSGYKFDVENGKMYISWLTTGTLAPVTDGSIANQGSTQCYLFVLDASGNIEYGGQKFEGILMRPGIFDLIADNNKIYVSYSFNKSQSGVDSATDDFIITDGSTATDGYSTMVLLRVFDTFGSLVHSGFLGGEIDSNPETTGAATIINTLKVENGNLYFQGLTSSFDMPYTKTYGLPTNARRDVFIGKYDPNFVKEYLVKVSGSGQDNDKEADFYVENGELYLATAVVSEGLPVTAGLNAASPLVGANHAWIAKFTVDGLIDKSTYISGAGDFLKPSFIMTPAGLVVSMERGNKIGTANFEPIRVHFLGHDLVLNNTVEVVGNNLLGGAQLAYIKGHVFMVYTSKATDIPTTDGSTPTPGYGTMLMDLSGNIVYNSTFPSDARVIVFGSNYILTVGSTNYKSIAVDDCSVYVGLTYNPAVSSIPGTTASTLIPNDVAFVKLDLAPIFNAPNTLSPASQTGACVGMIIEKIEGTPVKNTTGNITAHYEWEEATAMGGPWSTIMGEFSQDYMPAVTTMDKYYRRIAKDICTGNTISTSDPAFVQGSANTAPVVNTFDIQYACDGSTIQLGNLPESASGGTAPYTYQWEPAGLVASPTSSQTNATVTESTIFTLEVTDANGCVAYGQQVVIVPTVDAGEDLSVCDGTAVTIGSPGLPAATGVTYAWTPALGLSCSTCPQTTTSITGIARTFTLTATVPLALGGTCTISDAVTVTPVTPPAAGNFAGPDVVFCKGLSGPIGDASLDASYSYTWAPGAYLESNDDSEVVFNAGSEFPNPNVINYFLTAEKDGCVFTDEIEVAVIEADAEDDGCGPRYLGEGDETPDVNDTYSWTKLTGDATFLTATNIPRPQVTGATVASEFELVVTYNGYTCKDSVIVNSGCGCGVEIEVEAPAGCPSLDLGPVELVASGDAALFTYSWSPAAGLNTTTGKRVSLTDSGFRTYTVTKTSILDPSFFCTESIVVNDPAMSLPVVDVIDPSVICEGGSIEIGGPLVALYTYEWVSTDPSLIDVNSSNPTVMPTDSSTYFLTVTDSGTECIATAETMVFVPQPIADAGEDLEVCGGSIVTIGTPDPSNGDWTYQWDPPTAPWRNGTDANSAQPDVLVAANLNFVVTVTDVSSGCIATDDLSIIVNDAAPVIADAPNVTICEGETEIIGSPEEPGLLYSWSPAAGLSCTDCAQPEVSTMTNQTYTVTVTRIGSCVASSTDDVIVTVNTLPTVSLGAALTYCPGDPGINIGGNAPAGMTAYEWTPATDLSDATIADPVATPSAAITYTLAVTDANGCVGTGDIEIVIPEAPDAGISKNICLSEVTTLGAATNTGTILWSGSEVADLSCTTCAEPVYTPSSAGTFTFTIEETIGGCAQTSDVVITVIEQVAPMLTIPTTICAGSCATIGTTAEVGKTYAWSPTTGLSDPYSATTFACPSATMTYTLTITDEVTGCFAETDVLVPVESTPAPAVTFNDINVCRNEAGSLAVTVAPAGSYNYQWSPGANLTGTTLANPSLISTAIAGTETYSVTVTNTTTGCYAVAEGDLIVDICLKIMGNVWNDANNTIFNELENTTDAGSSLYVYLIDPVTGLVIDMMPVNPDGSYEFDGNSGDQYQLVLTTDGTGTIGGTPPAPVLPTNWMHTGENKNGASETSSPGVIDLIVGTSDVIEHNFGIQQYPDTDSHAFIIGDPVPGETQSLTTGNSMGPLSGSDPEDGVAGVGSDFEVTDLSNMNGNILFYDYNNDGVLDPGEELNVGDVIMNYNPNLLAVSFTPSTGSTGFSFGYTTTDNAGVNDPTPATYQVNWTNPVLPIEIVEFEVTKRNYTSVLQWVTATEVNSDYFEIQRSKNGNNWAAIGKVKAAGDTEIEQFYNFTDLNPEEGINYYRLKVIDRDETFEYSVVKTIKYGELTFEPVIYPNPTMGRINLRNVLPDEIETIKIVDQLGRTVKVIEPSSFLQFDISELPSAIYTVNVTDKLGGVYNIKVLKE